MPAFRLASLKTAKAKFGADCDADHPSLQPYAVRVRKGGHAAAASLKMVCQLLHLAKHGATVYVRAYASAFAVMALTSLTWIDAIKSGLPVRRTEVNGDTLDGVAFRQKSKAGSPMLWWCLVLDFFGESGWYVTLSEVLRRPQIGCYCLTSTIFLFLHSRWAGCGPPHHLTRATPLRGGARW